MNNTRLPYSISILFIPPALLKKNSPKDRFPFINSGSHPANRIEHNKEHSKKRKLFLSENKSIKIKGRQFEHFKNSI